MMYVLSLLTLAAIGYLIVVTNKNYKELKQMFFSSAVISPPQSGTPPISCVCGEDWALPSGYGTAGGTGKVVFGNGIFVAGNAAGPPHTRVTSDGANWTRQTQTYGTQAIAFGGGRFARVNGDQASYSTDGLSWTTASGLPSGKSWRSMVYASGYFVATASDGTVIRSSDGSSWSTVSGSGIGNQGLITDGSTIWTNAGSIRYSTDGGATWTLVSGGSFPGTAIRAGSYFISQTQNNGDLGNEVWVSRSTDGITWTDATTQPDFPFIPQYDGDTDGVQYGFLDGVTINGNTIITGANYAGITRDNGATWETLPAITKLEWDEEFFQYNMNNWMSVAHGNDLLVSVCNQSPPTADSAMWATCEC